MASAISLLSDSINSSLVAKNTGKSQVEGGNAETKNADPGMSIDDKMGMWQASFVLQDDNGPQIDTTPLPMEVEQTSFDDPVAEQIYDKYFELIWGHVSYAWLLGQMRNKLLLANGDNLISRIRAEVFRTLPRPSRVSIGYVPTYSAFFIVDWPLKAFLQSQLRRVGECELGHVLTISGTLCDAQALTCNEYMEQTWPSSGIHLVRLIQSLKSSEEISPPICERSDGARIEVKGYDESTVRVFVQGTTGMIAEVAEQLSWLGAALSVPSVSMKRSVFDNEFLLTRTPLVESQNNSLADVFSFRIRFETKAVGLAQVEGACWREMIRGCVLAQGFPIRRRDKANLGLEMSLKVMADLMGTRHVNEFAGHVFIKGYSALLIPTLQVNDVLVWHLARNRTNDHVSYLDHNVSQPHKVGVDRVASFRHVVGWCSNALNYAGAADGEYNIQRTRLPQAGQDCVLTNDSVSFGRLITSDHPHLLPAEWQTTHVGRIGYPDILRYLSQNFVLLWDTCDQRGWLVNGINALLHLLRASLSFDARDSVGLDFILRPTNLREPSQPHSAKAARQFLSDPSNLLEKISVVRAKLQTSLDHPDSDPNEYELLTDRMEQYYHVLEKALTYSKKLQTIPDGKSKFKAGCRLEGWDLVDLVTKNEPVIARTAELPHEVHGWLDLVRSIGVATVFGQGLGEIIRPSPQNCCEYWSILPKRKHYVAANVVDVKQIMELNGDPGAEPRLLAGSVLWHHPSTAFGNCGCEEPGGLNTRIVQQPCSTRRVCLCPTIDQSKFDLTDHENGAVVFGYNAAYGPLPVEELDAEFEDSGLGTSIVEITTNESDLTANSTFSQSPAHRGSISRQYSGGIFNGGNAILGDSVQINNYYTTPSGSPVQTKVSSTQLNSPPLARDASRGTKRGYFDNEMSVEGTINTTTLLPDQPDQSKRPARRQRRNSA